MRCLPEIYKVRTAYNVLERKVKERKEILWCIHNIYFSIVCRHNVLHVRLIIYEIYGRYNNISLLQWTVWKICFDKKYDLSWLISFCLHSHYTHESCIRTLTHAFPLRWNKPLWSIFVFFSYWNNKALNWAVLKMLKLYAAKIDLNFPKWVAIIIKKSTVRFLFCLKTIYFVKKSRLSIERYSSKNDIHISRNVLFHRKDHHYEGNGCESKFILWHIKKHIYTHSFSLSPYWVKQNGHFPTTNYTHIELDGSQFSRPKLF